MIEICKVTDAVCPECGRNIEYQSFPPSLFCPNEKCTFFMMLFHDPSLTERYLDEDTMVSLFKKWIRSGDVQ